MGEPLHRSVRVACSLEHAFTVFTSKLDMWWPRSHRRWRDSTLTLEHTLGGRFFERAAQGQEADLGEVLLWEPPHRVTYSWNPGSPVGPTTVDVRFTEEPGATLVEIEHSEGDSGLGSQWPERAQLFRRAWSTVLPAFTRFIETHPPR